MNPDFENSASIWVKKGAQNSKNPDFLKFKIRFLGHIGRILAKNVSEGELNIQNTDTLQAIKIRPEVLLCLFKITNWFLEN